MTAEDDERYGLIRDLLSMCERNFKCAFSSSPEDKCTTCRAAEAINVTSVKEGAP